MSVDIEFSDDYKLELQESYFELFGEEPDKRWSTETLKEKIANNSLEENELEVEHDKHPASFEYDGSFTKSFVNDNLSGSDEFLEFINNYMHEHIWIIEKDDDINYYDWLFHQHLTDAYIAYSRFLLNEKNEEYTGYLDRLELKEGVDVVWHDIYTLIVKDNKNIRFAKYYEGVK